MVAYLRDQGEYDVYEADLLAGTGDRYRTVDVRNAGEVSELAAWARPDITFNFAGVLGRVVAEACEWSALDVNVRGAMNVARYCSAGHLVHVSSSEAYGPHEGKAREDQELRPNNWYGVSKKLGEEVVRYWTQGRATIVRPFMFYHEDEVAGAHRSAMIRMATAMWECEPFEIHEGARRGWLHYDDAIHFIAECGRRRIEGPINFGHPDIRPIADLVCLMTRHFGDYGAARNFTTVPIPRGMTLEKQPDLSRQMGHDLMPAVSLEAGVARVCRRIIERADGRAA